VSLEGAATSRAMRRHSQREMASAEPGLGHPCQRSLSSSLVDVDVFGLANEQEADHQSLGRSVEETGCCKRTTWPVEWRDLAKWAMKVERVEIVFAGSARQRVKKTSPILLSVPN